MHKKQREIAHAVFDIPYVLFFICLIKCCKGFVLTEFLRCRKFRLRIGIRVGQDLLNGTVYIRTETGFSIELKASHHLGRLKNLFILIRELIYSHAASFFA